MMMSELADSAYLSQHGLFIVLVSALAMQLIVIFCNLQEQPTCIKNIKKYYLTPVNNIRLKF